MNQTPLKFGYSQEELNQEPIGTRLILTCRGHVDCMSHSKGGCSKELADVEKKEGYAKTLRYQNRAGHCTGPCDLEKEPPLAIKYGVVGYPETYKPPKEESDDINIRKVI